MKLRAQNTDGTENGSENRGEIIRLNEMNAASRTSARSAYRTSLSITTLMLLVFLACPTVAQEQAGSKSNSVKEIDQAEEVIRDFIEAIGGEMRLRSIGDVRIKGHINYADKVNKARFTWRFRGSKFSNSHKNRNHKTYYRGFDGKETCWGRFQGNRWKVEKPSLVSVKILRSPTQILEWIDDPPKLMRMGITDFAGQKAIQVDFTYPGDVVIHRFFDADSKRLLGERMPPQSNLERRFDYKEQDGVLFFDRIESISSGTLYCQMVAESLETNVVYETALFDPPDDE